MKRQEQKICALTYWEQGSLAGVDHDGGDGAETGLAKRAKLVRDHSGQKLGSADGSQLRRVRKTTGSIGCD